MVLLPRVFEETMRGTDSSVPPPPPRPAILPPADDRFALCRAFVLDGISGYKVHSARVLASRADLGDREAWEAVARDMSGPGRGYSADVAEALGRGDLDAAVREAAKVCGDLDVDGRPDGDRWCREMREEIARKGGVR